MSVLISTCYDINRSCTNNSLTKHLYTFPKSRRFDNNETITSHIVPGDIKDNKSKFRGASIGYGKKYDYFTRNVKNKSDKFYLLKSDFDQGGRKTENPSYSFGKKANYKKLYDENIKFNYHPDQPGPGSYKLKDSFGNPSYSFGGRNFIYGKKPNFPGSGTYNHDQLNLEGKYVLSKDKSVSKCTFGSSQSPRFSEVIKRKSLVNLIIY